MGRHRVKLNFFHRRILVGRQNILMMIENLLLLQSNIKISICLNIEHYFTKFLHGFGMISHSKLTFDPEQRWLTVPLSKCLMVPRMQILA